MKLPIHVPLWIGIPLMIVILGFLFEIDKYVRKKISKK